MANPQLKLTATKMGGGLAANAGTGQINQLAVLTTWATGDTISLSLTEIIASLVTLVGAGPATGAAPVDFLTLDSKEYFLSGTAMFFSGLSVATLFNNLTKAGNGFEELADQYGFADDLLRMAIFRKQVAVFGREHIQIINVDPDPANYSPAQTLENIGTVNGASVRGLGTLDVLFCAESGVRSLAARSSTEDAETVDLGTPIDKLIVAALAANGASVMASVVEPESNRYWLAIGTTIYVFSYFRSSGVVAWSTYIPTGDSGVAVAPPTSSYVTGLLTMNVTAGTVYTWVPGAHEVSLSNGTESYAVGAGTVTFIAQGATVTVNGIPLQTYTGSLRAHVTFTPEKFEVLDGQVYVRATNGKIYRYYGYDASVCSWETPWQDGRTPATRKPVSGIDAGMEGAWVVKLGLDWKAGSASLREVYRNTDSSFQLGKISARGIGEFYKVRGETTGAAYARFAMFVLHHETGSAG